MELVNDRLYTENNLLIWVGAEVAFALFHEHKHTTLPAPNCKVKEGEGVVGTGAVLWSLGISTQPLDEVMLDTVPGTVLVEGGVGRVVFVVIIDVGTVLMTVYCHYVVHVTVFDAANHSLPAAQRILHQQVVVALDESGAPTEGPTSSLKDLKDVCPFEHSGLRHHILHFEEIMNHSVL